MLDETLGVHLALGVVLFFASNWLGRHSGHFGYTTISLFEGAQDSPAFNVLFRVLTPVVFLVIACTSLYALGLDRFVLGIWLVVLYSFTFRIVFNAALGRMRLMHWPSQLVYFLFAQGAAYVAYSTVLRDRSALLPDMPSMTGEVWLIVAAYLYAVVNRLDLTSDHRGRQRTSYIRAKFQSLRASYHHIVSEKLPTPALQAMAYAIMIVENFNRPRLLRGLEVPLLWFGLARSLGIMQVRTSTLISDPESVSLGCDVIVTLHRQALIDDTDEETAPLDEKWRREVRESKVVGRIAHGYNPSSEYATEVSEVYREILPFFGAEARLSVLDPLPQSTNAAAQAAAGADPPRRDNGGT